MRQLDMTIRLRLHAPNLKKHLVLAQYRTDAGKHRPVIASSPDAGNQTHHGTPTKLELSKIYKALNAQHINEKTET